MKGKGVWVIGTVTGRGSVIRKSLQSTGVRVPHFPKVGERGVCLAPQTPGGSFHRSTCEANHVAGDVGSAHLNSQERLPTQAEEGPAFGLE